MPNHVDHDCWIAGPADAIQDLVATTLKPDGALNATALIPYPAEYQVLDDAAARWEEEQKALGLPAWEGLPENGYSQGGYVWCCDHWGTKWGTYDGSGVAECATKRAGRRKIQLRFLTAWAPAFPVYAALAARYPTCWIRIRYYEGGEGYQGFRTYRKGVLQLGDDMPYNGHRGG